MNTKLYLRLGNRAQSGFSLLEVMIRCRFSQSGLVGVLGVFGLAIAANQRSQQDMLARQLASEAMESIFTARNTSQLSFSKSITSPTEAFSSNGASASLCAGPTYGIVGSWRRLRRVLPHRVPCCPNGGVECLTEPGPDGIVGTADDVILSLTNFTRTITIYAAAGRSGNPIPTLVQVTITINYTVPNPPWRNPMCLKNTFPRTTRKGLMRRTPKSSLGFSLLELMISAATGPCSL